MKNINDFGKMKHEEKRNSQSSNNALKTEKM